MARKPATVQTSASFFKVLLGNFTEKLRLPPAFVKNVEGKLPLKFILRNSAGRCWHVKVERFASYLFFQNGWAEFVKENLLQIGDTVVFGYAGDIEINVTIFGRNGCEKEDTLLDTNCDESILLEEKKELQREREKVVERPGCYHCKCFSGRWRNRLKLSKEVSSCDYFFPQGGRNQLKQEPAVSSCPFNLEHPHFTRIWKKAIRYSVLIPVVLVKANNLDTQEHAYLHDHNKKRWKVSLNKWIDGRVLFGSGWSAFTREHSLRHGDVCGFEFIRGGTGRGACMMIEVHIFRKGRRLVID